MYNEVNCNCPSCNCNVCVEVAEYVPGFTTFYLNNARNFLILDEKQLKSLKKELKEKKCKCANCKCEFYPLGDNKIEEKVVKIKKILFDE